ncbi:hypothetical protein D9757_015509 [Collybiopsis confluens]|uniref:Uncharacterized protein n=1 Tax=Collybiopsis confluens TaxID=2823264 RepID=A0A8H5FF33_9AGAR|nr:hypothetical protein D9757_015509 [Collybiopsis confluens]
MSFRPLDNVVLPEISSTLLFEVDSLAKSSELSFWNSSIDEQPFRQTSIGELPLRISSYQISYERNEELPQCAENEALDGTEDGSGGLMLSKIEEVENLYPCSALFVHIVRLYVGSISTQPGWDASFGPIQVTYKTVFADAPPKVTYKPAMDPERSPVTPQAPLALPSVPLRSLRRRFYSNIAMNIDLVALESDVPSILYAFKMLEIPLSQVTGYLAQ